MRFLLSLLVCLLVTIPQTVSAHYIPGIGDAFVLVRVEGERGPDLQDAGLYLVAEVPDGYLAFVDSHELEALRSEGIASEILEDRDTHEFEYLIVYEREHEHPLAEPHPKAETLFQGEGYRVMRVPAELLEAQPTCVLEIQRVYRRPLSFVRRPWTDASLQARGVTADPDVVAALASIVQADLQTHVQTLQDYGTRHSQYNGGLLASQWIRDQFLSYGYTDVTFHDYNSWNDNVVCVKTGSVFPDEVVVIGAHYDTISGTPAVAPGADDNASGSVAVLEAARVLAGIEFERTIIFICFSGEEQGLVGSDAWAAEAAAANMDIVGMINLDMICYRAPGDAEDLDIIWNSASSSLADLAAEAMALYVPELTTVDGFLTSGSSDHAAFWANGFRAIFLFEDSGSYSPFIHSTSDVIGTSANDFPFMHKNVRGAAAALAALARPFHVALDHLALENSASTGPFPLAVEILAAEPLDPSSLQLHYRLDGGAFEALDLTATGTPDEYGATIPVVSEGTLVEYYLSASDIEGFTSTSPELAPAELHGFRAGIEFVFVEDAEADLGWTLGVPGDDATTGVWIRDVPVSSSYQPGTDHTPGAGTMCFVTGNAAPGDGAGVNDVDGGRTTLLSPAFDLSGRTWAGLTYWRWFVDETAYDDAFYVDISNDDGASWHSLEIVTASAYPWVRVEIDDLGSILSLTDQMRLRFVAEDVGQGSLVEALIDDLEILASSAATTAVIGGPGFEPSLRAFPSPVGRAASLQFTLPSSGEVAIRVYDARGAEVARPVDGSFTAGEHTMGLVATEFASGTYFAKLWFEGEVLATTKLTVVK